MKAKEQYISWHDEPGACERMFNADFWHSEPTQDAVIQDWCGADFTVTIMDENGDVQSMFEIRDLTKNVKVKGKRSPWLSGKYGHALMFAYDTGIPRE